MQLIQQIMKQEFINIAKHIHRFGMATGLKIYFQNNCSKKGESAIVPRGYPHPIFLRRPTSDILTFGQVFLNQEYAYPLAFDPEFIIDCGANIGLASVYFKNRHPNAFIVSIEPEESNFKLLQRNVSGYSKMECIQSGVWNKNAILKVEDELNLGHWGFVCKEVAVEGPNTVRAVSVKEIMHRHHFPRIDILKIDVEGAELELFSSGYEEWLPLTRVIMIELHDRFRKGCSKSFFSALVKYDFSVFQSGENLICIRNEAG